MITFSRVLFVAEYPQLSSNQGPGTKIVNLLFVQMTFLCRGCVALDMYKSRNLKKYILQVGCAIYCGVSAQVQHDIYAELDTKLYSIRMPVHQPYTLIPALSSAIQKPL